MAFLYKSLLRIFEDSGSNHIGRGVDRDISLGDVYCQKIGIKKRKWNRNLEKRQSEESVSRSSEKRFQQIVCFLDPLGDGESKPTKLLPLGVGGFGGPQNNVCFILRTQARLYMGSERSG